MTELHELSLKETVAGLQSKKFSSTEVTDAYIKQIENNRDLNAYVLETFDKARESAKIADKNIAAGNARPLEGVPLGIKDLYCTKGTRTTACSNILRNFVPPYESTITQNLWNAGALMLGKLNMDEFAMGGTNTTSCFGPVKNPWDKTRIPGGSSGGSAAATATDMACATLGSETGDSIRTPASMCGVVGMKPSYGRCSRYGMISYSSSLDQGGPITKTVADAAIMLKYMAGYDHKDSVCADLPVPDYEAALTEDVKGMRVGYIREFNELGGVHEDVYKGYRGCLDAFKAAGADIVEVSIPHVIFAGQIYAVLANCEAASNLARYDGVRYGLRVDGDGSLDDMYLETRGKGFGWQIKRRLVIGSYMLSAEQYDSYFKQAQRIRRLLFNEFAEAYKQVDVIMAPITPDAPCTIEQVLNGADVVSRQGCLIDLLTMPMAMAGVPGIAVPAGSVGGMPFGIQLCARRFDEETVFHAGYALEQMLKGDK